MKEKQKIVGKRIRLIRELKGMSQEDLANKCGHVNEHARSWISKIESGIRCPTLDDVFLIADALGIEAYILFMDESPTSQQLDMILTYTVLFQKSNTARGISSDGV